MRNSILLETLGALAKEDLPELHKFICSPFFNRDRNSDHLIALFEYIQSYYPDFQNEDLEKEKVYHYLFPNQEIVKNKVEKLMSGLLSLVKEFIIYQFSGIKQDEHKRLLSLGQFYKEKKLVKRFGGIVKRLEHTHDIIGGDIDFYYSQFLSHQLISEFTSFQNKRKGDDLNLPKTLDSLDAYFVLNKLQFANIIILQNQFRSKSNFEQIILLPEILKSIKAGAYSHIPLIQLYYHSFYMLQEPYEASHYQVFKNILDQYSASLSSILLRQFQVFTVNFCVLKYNNGCSEYLEEIFSLYQKYLSGGHLYYKGKLRPSTFKNIVNFGLKLKQFEWIKRFLETHRNRITQTQYPQDVFHFNMAVYYFHLKQYDQAIDYLSDTYEDVYYNLAARRLEIKIYYETNSPILEARMDAFKAFLFRLSRQILSNEQKKLNNNFIDLLRQINHPKTLKNSVRIKKLIGKVQKTKLITERNWLIEKLETLK